MDFKDPIRKSIMSLSLFCGVSLFLLGMLSKRYDIDYIMITVLTFIFAYLDPYVKLTYKRYTEKKAREKKLKKEAEKKKNIQERLNQIQIQKQIEFEQQQEREKQEAIRIAQENLRKKASGKTRFS